MQDAAIATLSPPPHVSATGGHVHALRRPPDERAEPAPGDGEGEGAAHGHVSPSLDAAAAAPEASAGRPVQLSRQQILGVTARCLRREGYDATTIRRIAKELGCAVGSIYRYFRDKRELLTAVAEQLLLPAADLADEGLPFEEVARTYLKGAARDRSAYQLMFWLASLGDEASHAAVSGNGNGNGNGNGRANGDAAARAADATASDPAHTAAVAAGAESATLPRIVERIIAACRPCFADADAGRRCWAALHGAVLLGMSFDEALAAMRPFLSRPAAPREGEQKPSNNRLRLARHAPTHPVTLDDDAPHDEDAEQPSDVCLL